jgi:hypothetical protein
MINQIEEETGSLPPNLPRGVPPEVAQANPDVQAIIAPRLTMLMEIANSFLMTIIDSMDSVPYGIRWICKQIRSLTRVRVNSSRIISFLTPSSITAKVSRGNGLCYLFTYWRIFLFAVHQSRSRHTTGIYVGRRRSGETPKADFDAGEQYSFGYPFEWM